MDVNVIKTRARTLVAFLKTRQFTLPYQTAVDAVSVLETGRDFNTVSAVAKNAEPPSAPDATPPAGHTGCNCKLCQQNRVFYAKLEALPEEQRGYFEAVYEDLMETKMDNDYHTCILDGSWTSSVEILEAALVRAKQKRAEQEVSQ